MSSTPSHEWGLQIDITPRFGARLVQEGKPIPDNRGDISTRLMEHIRDNPAKENYEDDFFCIRYFQKGTAHLTFKRLGLIERMNDIIAKHCPGMLAKPS
ncbi:DUF4942 domain-containing protein [Yersinia kristensenii]|uniref:DUF4942 domain-containing protein n=1 Tax=Yersinia kristensenii TaxID=28152 RepID=UPI0005DD90B0|nr:z1226 protein [Yersinia kristensenii]